MHPDFFSASPVIVLRDPLAEFLGASTDGLIEYRYTDAVRLAGHSCPTVVSAFLLLRRALAALYPHELPVRGDIRIDFAERQDAGVTGVVAAIGTLVTGATADTGFAGLAGLFNRRDKLYFNQTIKVGSMRLTRLDSGQRVEARADLSSVPADPRVGDLLPKCLKGQATADEVRLFRQLWQARVERLLIDHKDDALVFKVFA